MAARADGDQLAKALGEAQGLWLLVAFGLASLNICVGVARWRLMLRAFGVVLPWGRALRLSWAGQFFNTFVPSGVAGDALRSAWTAEGNDPYRAAASVVLDRAAAVVALGGTVGLGLALPVAARFPGRVWLAGGALLVGLVGIAMLSLPGPVASLALRVRGAKAPPRWVVALQRPVLRAPRAAAVGLACVTEALIVATGIALARAAGVSLSWEAALATIPAAMVTAYVPFAISGMGVRDAALVALLGQVGISASGAWAISVLFLLTAWAVGAVGGLVYWASAGAPRPQKA